MNGPDSPADAGHAGTPPNPPIDPVSGRDPDGITHCDLCGHAMLEWHCRLVCPACGFQRDCSDP